MSERHPFDLSVVILAAGNSSRMGQPKMLLRWRGSSIVGHLISIWKELGARHIAVVTAADDAAMEAELNRLGFPKEDRIVNPEPGRGMFSSVRCAAEWSAWDATSTHWAIALGDQPHLRRQTLVALIDFARGHPGAICQPGRGGHGLHPVVLPKRHFEKLNDSKAATLKEFLQSMADDVKLMETADAGADLDIDLPEDYEKAKQLERGSAAT